GLGARDAAGRAELSAPAARDGGGHRTRGRAHDLRPPDAPACPSTRPSPQHADWRDVRDLADPRAHPRRLALDLAEPRGPARSCGGRVITVALGVRGFRAFPGPPFSCLAVQFRCRLRRLSVVPPAPPHPFSSVVSFW